MKGRHPDFTTSRLSITATDTANGCIWVLKKRENEQVALIQLTGQQLSSDAIDPSDRDGYIQEALTVILSYLARTLLLPFVTGEGGEAEIWLENGFYKDGPVFRRDLTH
ncbi:MULTISPECIES: hypothetical protein [Exiguobacterium]|uniref:Uncharacterized protein n=1 Tax=Exiguobacterium sibiricum (strain DSM 17290 / CCUG 55495 / CIP 109462 / JCM 13490 / 255-15) TaxID=262543 RepID=B1YHZ6_EXIS2|nr:MULTISPECIES: hypothetical protein [Exiguobacterium]ACB59780.1 hypothetical protein Exig_0294 [Exiguobacterium sibiricum 255-15]MCT4793752.1 hypothetical protein [Exiguobacterium artemiae]